MVGREIIRKIQEIAGNDRVSHEKEDLVCYSYDAMNIKALPDLVVFPASAQEISRILSIANEERIPVVPRGAGSNLIGAAVPVQGGIVLSFEKMNRILKIDEENLVAVVEPGVITGDFHRAVEAKGLFYPPDPASLDFCTLGGNVATCAGGLRAVKYGVTKDYVLGVEVVLPSGEIVSTGVETVKRVVGYDLTKLIVGSEGTLGVVTKIILKLIPKPETRKTLMAAYPKMEDAVRTVSDIFRAKILPATIEFMDRICIRCVSDFAGMSISDDIEALLLLEDDGPIEVVERHGKMMAEICMAAGARNVSVAANDEESDDLWKARRAISPSLSKIAPHRFNEDIAVPRTKLPELVHIAREVAGRFGVKNANFGHAGDGNIHLNILYNADDPDETARARDAVGEIMKKAVEMGGTISGEHGIGLAKLPFIEMELGDLGISVMRRIKKAFDPNGIMNPGKILP